MWKLYLLVVIEGMSGGDLRNLNICTKFHDEPKSTWGVSVWTKVMDRTTDRHCHPKSHAARTATKKGGVKPHMITIIMSYKQTSRCALSPFCLASSGATQLSLRSSQWHYPAEIILCPFSELVPWHWAMGKCIRIDYLSCRQVWLCRRLSYWLLGGYWFPRSINNILCCYIKRTVKIRAPSWDVVTLVFVLHHSAP